jgi:hypothetical protein
MNILSWRDKILLSVVIYYCLLYTYTELHSLGLYIGVGSNNYGNLLYDHWVLDAASLLDLCALYGSVVATEPSFTLVMREFLTFVFAIQPSYLDDVSETRAILMKVIQVSIWI